jgi:hypothetical protein
MAFSQYDPEEMKEISKEGLAELKSAVERLGWTVWGFRAEFDADLQTDSLKIVLIPPAKTNPVDV